MTEELKNKLWPIRRKLHIEQEDYTKIMLGDDTREALKYAIRVKQLWCEVVDELKLAVAHEVFHGRDQNE